MLSAHMGNWELMGAALSLWGYPINVIARRIYIPRINGLLLRLRQSAGMRVILREGASSAKDMLRALRKNEVIGMLMDQDAHVQGVWVDFFGIPAFTPSGPAAIALKSGARVVSAFMVRDGSGGRIEIRGPYSLVRTGDHERDVLENTRMFTGIIERYVRRYPEQWVWMHDRWKHRRPEAV